MTKGGNMRLWTVVLMTGLVCGAWADGAFAPAVTVTFTDTRTIAAHVQALGKRASFEGRTGLRVSGVRFSLSEQGAYTDVTLRKDDA